MVLGDPVSGKEFFDRNKEMAILFSALNDFKKGNRKKENHENAKHFQGAGNLVKI